MSGVEILGIVAASSQLLGQGAKALLALSGLCSRLRDAPHEVLKTVEEIENLIQLTESIKTSLENTSFTLHGGNSSASSQLAFGVGLLEECAKESTDLENLIKPLLPIKSDSLIRRSWGAVIKTKKTKQILQRCRHIEAKKSSLILWLNFVKLSQAYEQSATVQSISTTIALIEKSILGLQLSDDHLRNDIGATNQYVSKTNEGFVEMRSKIKQIQQDISLLEKRVQGPQNAISSGVAKTAVIQSDIQHINNTAEKAIEQTPKKPSEEAYEQIVREPAQRMLRRLVRRPSVLQFVCDNFLDEEGDLIKQKSRYSRSYSCGCKPISSRFLLSQTAIKLMYGIRKEHHSNCPWHISSKSSWSLALCASILPIIGKAFEITFSITRGAGGFSLAPYFAVTNIVQRNTSPAFQLFDKVYETLRKMVRPEVEEKLPAHTWRIYDDLEFDVYYEWDIYGLEVYLKELMNVLQVLFHTGKASPQDQDEDGRTYLHEITILATELEYRQKELIPILAEVVSGLIDFGVDKTAIAFLRKRGTFSDRYATDALSLATISFVGYGATYASTLKYEEIIPATTIDLILIEHGCEFVVDPGFFRSLKIESMILQKLPDLAWHFGYGPLTLAVLLRSEHRLHRLLAKGVDPNGDVKFEESEMNSKFLARIRRSALEFTILWHDGMKILLDAGADPSLAIFEAIAVKDYQAIQALLERDCPVGVGRKWYCKRKDISTLIIHQLKIRREHLRNLASRHLSTREQRELRLQIDPILDDGANQVVNALCAKGITVPRSLMILTGRTVYHDQNITPNIADQLKDCGFQYKDLIDRRGYSPTLLSCFAAEFDNAWEMLLWHLNMGARPTYEIVGPQSCAVHLISWYGYRRDCQFETAITRLHAVCDPLYQDGCICACSLGGCTAVQNHLKRKKYMPSWKDREALLQTWIRSAKITHINEQYHYNACRLEIFERLGMAHTCCKQEGTWPKFTADYNEIEDSQHHERLEFYARATKNKSGGTSWLPKFVIMSDEDRWELEEEDSELREQLEFTMQAYETARKHFCGSFEEFWEEWWTAVNNTLPEVEDGPWREMQDNLEGKDSLSFVKDLKRSLGSLLPARYSGNDTGPESIMGVAPRNSFKTSTFTKGWKYVSLHG